MRDYPALVGAMPQCRSRRMRGEAAALIWKSGLSPRRTASWRSSVTEKSQPSRLCGLDHTFRSHAERRTADHGAQCVPVAAKEPFR